jgi:hypothetical protein
MERFVLLHASDLHFSTVARCVGAIPDFLPARRHSFRGRLNTVSTHNDDAADALAYFVCNYQRDYGQQLDTIVLSGDLACRGHLADLNAARDFITTPATQGHLSMTGQPTLNSTPAPIVIIPGNHDRFGQVPLYHVSLPLCPPGDTTFDAVFSQEWGAGQGTKQLHALRRGGATLVLLGADFTLAAGDFGTPIPLGHYGQGRAYQKRVRVLEQQTRQTRAHYPDCAVLWVVHFEPKTRFYLLKLLQEKRLIQAANQSGVAAILCGHTHRSRKLRRLGNTPLYVCGTTTQFYAPRGNYLHILEIEVDPSTGTARVTKLQRFRFDPLPPGNRRGFNLVP